VKRLLVVATTVILLATGCAAPATSVPTARVALSLNVGNATALDVTLVVNGEVEGVYAANGPLTTLDPAKLPALPWTVEAKSPTGRILTTMTVTLDDATQSDPNVHRIPSNWVDLSCGRLTIWAGDYPPSGGPVPPSPAGSPGDCAP